jgi:MscS family membrane protein
MLDMLDKDILYDIGFFIGVWVIIFILRNIILNIILKRLFLLSQKSKTKYFVYIIQAIRTPINLFFISIGGLLSTNFLYFGDNINFIIHRLFNCMILFAIFLAILNYAPHLAKLIVSFISKEKSKIRNEIVYFIEILIKSIVSFIGFALLLQEWGYNISTLVASLGIGGLAFALAAKDTLANIFGYFVVFTQSPFVKGDWIQIGDTEGTVENINIRSTTVRTFSHSLIYIPNSILTTSSIENFSKRGKRRIKFNLTLTYNTTKQQLQSINKDIKNMLINHKDIDKETILIYFDNFSASSLDIFCYFFTISTNWQKYLSVKEDVYYEIISIIEANKASFAYPTQSIYIENK